MLIDRQEYEARTDALRDLMAERGLDAFVLTNEASVYYLCGYDPHQGTLLVSQDDSVLVVCGPYVQDAQGHAVVTSVFDKGESAYATSAEVLGRSGARVVGFDAKDTTAFSCRELTSGMPGLELRAADSLILGLRERKSVAEVACLTECSRCAERGFVGLLKTLTTLDNERQMAAKLDYWMRMNGAQNTAFPVRVAFGSNADVSHKMPGEGVMVPGGVVMFDWGAMIDRYNSDLTRVGVFRPDGGKWVELHGALADCLRMLEVTVKPGMKCAEARAMAEERLSPFGGQFVWSLGHGIGLEAHEPPHMTSHSDSVFQVGQVVCLEPGLYFYQQGCMRLEDMFEVTAGGLRKLTELPYADFIRERA